MGFHFADALTERVFQRGPLCLGLDPQYQFMPPHLIRSIVNLFGRSNKAMGHLFTEFNYAALEAVHDIVPVVKPQIAFYEEYGSEGVEAYEKTIARAKELGMLVIIDAKRGDGGDTARAYAEGHLGEVPFFGDTDETLVAGKTVVGPMRVDCMTVLGGYIGETFVKPILEMTAKCGTGVFFVDKTSFQPVSAIELLKTKGDMTVWEEQAFMVRKWGEGTEGACGVRRIGVVIGATFPEEAVRMREILPDSIFLIPGYGAQGGGADGAVVGLRQDGSGGTINSSRAILAAWCAKDKKTKAPGPYFTTSENFQMAIRRAAIDSQRELILAAQKSGKWPHGMPKLLAV